MSHQTGIRADEELIRFFREAKKGGTRIIKVSIKDSNLTLSFHTPIQSDFKNDYGKMINRICEPENIPCFVLCRLDTKTMNNYDWLFIAYAPDLAPVKYKMLYAATRATLKAEFGQNYIKQEMHCATKDEVTLEGYERYLTSKLDPGPMTEVEIGLKSLREEEVNAQFRHDSSRSLPAQTLRGVAFPIDQQAQEKLIDLKERRINYVQLSVDTLNEAIKLEVSDRIDANSLKTIIPKNKPRYHFFLFKHTHEGEFMESIVFLYSMPNSGCSIKERMLYSSCKGPFVETVHEFLGLKADRKLEIDSQDEVNEAYLLDQVHPQIHLHQPAFNKPKPPQSRGLRRITKIN